MNIGGLGYNERLQALEIYISGCDGACKGCHNKELWDFDAGENWEYYGGHFRQKLSSSMVQNIWIMGGEPLLQANAALEVMLQYLEQYTKDIWLWTRFYQIPSNIKQYLTYAKVGEYREDSESYVEPLFGIKLASLNQEIRGVK